MENLTEDQKIARSKSAEYIRVRRLARIYLATTIIFLLSTVFFIAMWWNMVEFIRANSI